MLIGEPLAASKLVRRTQLRSTQLSDDPFIKNDLDFDDDRGMIRETLESILDVAHQRLFRSTVICCDLSGVRESLGETLSDIVKERGNERIVDFSDLIPGLERYQDFQLMIWERALQAAPWNGHMLVLDAEDAMAKWSKSIRHEAWRFLSGLKYCGTVIVVSSLEPSKQAGFNRMGCLQNDGDFDKIPYFQSAHDHTIIRGESLAYAHRLL